MKKSELIPDDDKQIIERMAAMRYSTSEIAAKVKRNTKSVYNYLYRKGLRTTEPIDPHDVELMVALRNEGLPVKIIAEKFEMNYQRVYRLVNKHLSPPH